MRQARREVARSQCKLLKEPSRVFVTDEVLFVQSEKRVDQKLRNASHTACSVVNIGRVSEGAGEPQAELCTPQAFLDNPAFQRCRVLGHRFLEPGDFTFRVMKRNTDERLAEVPNTSEAVRRLLIVVVAPYPLSSFVDSLLNLVQVPIEKVHFAYGSLDPGAPVYPWSPLVRTRDNRDRSDSAEPLCDRSHLSHRKRAC